MATVHAKKLTDAADSWKALRSRSWPGARPMRPQRLQQRLKQRFRDILSAVVTPNALESRQTAACLSPPASWRVMARFEPTGLHCTPSRYSALTCIDGVRLCAQTLRGCGEPDKHLDIRDRQFGVYRVPGITCITLGTLTMKAYSAVLRSAKCPGSGKSRCFWPSSCRGAVAMRPESCERDHMLTCHSTYVS